jgi:arogenate dehydrogenase (NADP+), plant
MFGPDSGKNGWTNLNFVYEKTRVHGIVSKQQEKISHQDNADTVEKRTRTEDLAAVTSTEEYIEGVDRMERFLSIWEEEGCRMVSMSCRDHDTYAANSQFITHLMGRILGTQGLVQTPIDTSGFQSVLKLVDSTTADSFDLFYGLYKFNTNSMDTIQQLRAAMDDVVANLKRKEETDQEEQSREVERNWNAENKVESTLNVLYP